MGNDFVDFSVISFNVVSRLLVNSDKISLVNCFVVSVFERFILIVDKDDITDELIPSLISEFSWIDNTELGYINPCRMIKKVDGGYYLHNMVPNSGDYYLASLNNSIDEGILCIQPQKHSSVQSIIDLIKFELEKILITSIRRSEVSSIADKKEKTDYSLVWQD